MGATGQKGLTLKIAAGMFIGIMAALLVYSLPGWIGKHEEGQRVHDGLEREWWIEQMTPEQFPVRCGKLLKDESLHEQSIGSNGKVIEGKRFEARDVTVEMTKEDGKKEPVTAEYTNLAQADEEPHWNLMTIGTWRVFDDHDRSTLTYIYPCLEKPSAQ
jgi:hypothetical protein